LISNIVKYIIFLNAILFVAFYSIVDENNYLLTLYIYSFVQFIVVSFYYLKRYNDSEDSFNPANLKLEIGILSFIFVALNNYISYIYNKDFFVFSDSDARFYENVAISFINSSDSFFATLDRLGFDLLSFEDYGQIILVSIVYKIWQSNLMLNLYYIIIAVYGGYYLFLLSMNFMQQKYAYFTALIFYTSSFIFFYNSSGLKESQMIFFVIVSYYCYYKFLDNRKYIYVFYVILLLVLMVFFRPVVSILIAFSMILGYLLQLKVNKKFLIFISALIFILSLNISFVEYQQNRFTLDNFSELVESNESSGMIKGGIPFTYFVNTLSSLIGHFPTINLEKTPPVKNLCSSGLSYKVFFSFFYVYGLYLIFKNRIWTFLPIVFFILIESASLVYIFEGLELRKSLPHYPLIYVIIFWVINVVEKPIKNRLVINFKKRYINFYIFSCTALIIYWNIR
jgi:hypothetical protein